MGFNYRNYLWKIAIILVSPINLLFAHRISYFLWLYIFISDLRKNFSHSQKMENFFQMTTGLVMLGTFETICNFIFVTWNITKMFSKMMRNQVSQRQKPKFLPTTHYQASRPGRPSAFWIEKNKFLGSRSGIQIHKFVFGIQIRYPDP